MKTLRCISTAVLACLVLAAPAAAASTFELKASTESTPIGGRGAVSYVVSGSPALYFNEEYVLVISRVPQTEVKCPRAGASEEEWAIVAKGTIGNTPFEATAVLAHERYESKGRYTLCAMRIAHERCTKNSSPDDQCAGTYATLTVKESAKEATAREAEEAQEERETARKKAEREAEEKAAKERATAEEERRRYEAEHPPAPPAPPVVAPAPAPAPTVTLPPAPPVLTGSLANATSVQSLTTTQKLHKALAKCKRQHPKRKRVKCERAARKAASHR